MANISSLVDSLHDLPPSTEITVLGGAYNIAHTALQLDGQVRSTNKYDFDSVYIRVSHTQMGSGYYFGMTMAQSATDPDTYVPGRTMGYTIISVSGVKTLQLSWSGYSTFTSPTPTPTGGTGASGYYRIPYNATAHSFLKMTNALAGSNIVAAYFASPDGSTWSQLFTFQTTIDTTYQYRLLLGDYNSMTLVDDLNVLAAPWGAYPDKTTKPPRAPRTFDPTAVAPAKAKTCSNILDLVREFSASVRKAVRIVGNSTIEMVDPDEDLPTGYDSSGGIEYYTSTTMEVGANSTVLTLQKGDMDLNVSADIVSNDIGIIEGGFRIPQRMPFPGLDPAPVSSISYTMTPKTFTASLTLAYPDVPLVVRER